MTNGSKVSQDDAIEFLLSQERHSLIGLAKRIRFHADYASMLLTGCPNRNSLNDLTRPLVLKAYEEMAADINTLAKKLDAPVNSKTG